MSSVLIIASGQSATSVSLYESKVDYIVAVNNAWSLTDKWTYWVHPNDYAGSRPVRLTSNQTEIAYKEYSKALLEYGGQKECGFSITLNASYWVLYHIAPTVIYYLGADMNYQPDENGNTHFYGKGYDIKKYGISDPDIMVKLHSKGDVKYLENIYLRFKSIAEDNKCKVYNLSKLETTRLPFPRAADIVV